MGDAHSMHQFASWTDEELERGEQIATVTLCKALAIGDGYTQLAFAEQRLRQRLSRTHMAIARRADQQYIREVRAASKINMPWIKKHVGQYVASWDKWANDNAKAVEEVIRLAHVTGKTSIYQRAFGEEQRAIYNGPPYEQRAPVAEVPIEKVKAAALITPHTTLADAEAIRQITRGQMFWIGKFHDKELRKQIEQVSKEILLEQGLPREDAARRLATELGYNNGYLPVKPVAPIPAGWKGSTKQYFDGVAANAATVSRIHSSLTAMVELGFSVYEVLNPGDERTCPICDSMNGAVLNVRPAYQHIQEVIGATHPSHVKAAHPWISPGAFAAELRTRGMGGMVSAGLGYPPFHFKCRCSVDIRPESLTRPVTIPPDVKVPPKIRPIKPVTPGAFAHPEIRGPSAPVTYDEIKLRESLESHSKGNTSAKIQAEIRRQTNSLIYEEGGMIPHDIVYKRPNASKFSTYTSPSSYHGMHTWSGEARLLKARMEGAVRFSKKWGKSNAFDLNDFHVLIHESIHGTSPVTVEVYKGIGVFIEEISAEAAARHVLIRRYGYEWGQFIHYRKEINQAREAIRLAWKDVAKEIKLRPRNLSGAQINDFLSHAGVKMRNHIVKKPIDNPQDLLKEYVGRVADEFAEKAAKKGKGLMGDALTNFRNRAKAELTRRLEEAWKGQLI